MCPHHGSNLGQKNLRMVKSNPNTTPAQKGVFLFNRKIGQCLVTPNIESAHGHRHGCECFQVFTINEALLFLGRPIWVIKVYTLTGALFMPLLAGTLLWLNSRRSLVGELRNGFVAFTTLGLALVLFALILVRQIVDLL
jgi:hypothetical protein